MAKRPNPRKPPKPVEPPSKYEQLDAIEILDRVKQITGEPLPDNYTQIFSDLAQEVEHEC